MAKRNRVAYNIQDVFFGKPRGAPFFPTDISNCVAWYDFDDESTHELSPDDSTLLSAIEDKSEKSGKLSAPSEVMAPVVHRSSYNINNKTVAYFDGLNDQLDATMSTISEGHSIFIVAQQGWADDSEGDAQTYGLIGIHDTAFGNISDRGLGIYRGDGTATLYALYNSFGNERRHDLSGDTKTNIFTHQIHKNVAGNWALAPLRKNGLSVGVHYGTPALVSNCKYLTVGKHSGYFKGSVAEIIIYDRHLDVEETKTVEKYLSEKWNVSLSASDQQIDSFEILNRINRVQNFDYTFNVSRTSEGVLGKTMEVDRPIIEPPSIDITLSYFLDGGNNENRMGFDIAHPEKTEGSIGKIGEPNYKPPMLTNNFYDTGRYKDARNVYLVTNNNTENDIKEQRSGYPMFITGTAQIPKITDPNAAEYGVMAFQNCYVTNYTVDFSIESLPRAEVGLVADNVTFFGSGTGINIPRFNTERGVVEYNGKKMVVPKHFEEGEASIVNRLVSFMPGDITLSITKENSDDDINFHSDTIQSCNITVNCNRENIAYMGEKYYADKPIKTPMTVDTTVGMIVNENLTGDFSRDIKTDENYNVDILCKISGSTVMKYTFSGSKFDSVNYSSSIGSNKMANLQFSTAMDHDQFTKGLFVSGKLMEIQNEVTLATAGSDNAETDTDSVYEKGTDVGLSDNITDHDILYGNNPLF